MVKRKKKKETPQEQPPAEPAAPPSAETPPPQRIEVEAIELSEEAAKLVRQIETERDEAIAGRQRALADFVNFQRRARENEVRARGAGVGSVARALLPVLDHFDLALNQDREQITVDQLFDGVKIVREELNKALEGLGVSVCRPEIGDEFDPTHHQAVMRQPTEEAEPNTITAVVQVGYLMNETILRPASVVVAAPLEAEETAESEPQEEDAEE
jgi:molecular chaperone GrpE